MHKQPRDLALEQLTHRLQSESEIAVKTGLSKYQIGVLLAGVATTGIVSVGGWSLFRRRHREIGWRRK
jgi:hypothetical protein